MGAATTGTLTLLGASGQTYSRGIYIPDAVADVIRFDSGAGAGAATPDFATWSEPVTLIDFCNNGAAVPTALQVRLSLNGAPTSQLFRILLHVATNPSRPPIKLTIPPGSRLGGFMVA